MHFEHEVLQPGQSFLNNIDPRHGFGRVHIALPFVPGNAYSSEGTQALGRFRISLLETGVLTLQPDRHWIPAL